MTNKMIEYKESFITRVKNFFKNLFGINKLDVQETTPILDIETKEEKVKENVFLETIKVSDRIEPSIEYKRNEFLKEIEENDEMLENLSIDRLEKLTQYYDEIIKKNDEKIAKLKKMA